jgi:hypothetical protein
MGTRVQVAVDAGTPPDGEAAVRALFARREAALVNAGGDLAVLGRPGPGPGWEIAVRLPSRRERATLRAGALATAGASGAGGTRAASGGTTCSTPAAAARPRPAPGP